MGRRWISTALLILGVALLAVSLGQYGYMILRQHQLRRRWQRINSPIAAQAAPTRAAAAAPREHRDRRPSRHVLPARGRPARGRRDRSAERGRAVPVHRDRARDRQAERDFGARQQRRAAVDAGDLLPDLLDWAGAGAADRAGEAGAIASGTLMGCPRPELWAQASSAWRWRASCTAADSMSRCGTRARPGARPRGRAREC